MRLEHFVTSKQKETFDGYQIQVKILTEANMSKVLGIKNKEWIEAPNMFFLKTCIRGCLDDSVG